VTESKTHRWSARTLQVVAWLCLLLFLVFYSANKWSEEPRYAIYSALIAGISYIIAVYGNAEFLWPRFFDKGRTGLYILYTILFIGVLVVLRMYVENILLMPLHGKFYDWNVSHLSLSVITVSVAYLFGAFLRMGVSYINLSRTQEEMKRRQATTELELLKQQVQPHFLFNTLNNIYSLAHAKSDDTTIAIDKLAGIMRYFTEDAPKEKVSLHTEINFINNYISLEQLRMLHSVKIEKNISEENVQVPPMLLMPFVENLFKHGIDKTRSDNEAFISLKVDNGRLYYTVRNKLMPDNKPGTGIGLSNLKKRLDLLYKTDHRFNAAAVNGYFEAGLEIPV
jgi:sensor histidine kinase YesM